MKLTVKETVNANEQIVSFEILFLQNLYAENIISKTVFDLTMKDLQKQHKDEKAVAV